MTARLTEDNSSWLADWSLLAAAGETLPPRDPNVRTETKKTKRTRRTRTAMKRRRW
jgi:hypothetical protein